MYFKAFLFKVNIVSGGVALRHYTFPKGVLIFIGLLFEVPLFMREIFLEFVEVL